MNNLTPSITNIRYKIFIPAQCVYSTNNPIYFTLFHKQGKSSIVCQHFSLFLTKMVLFYKDVSRSVLIAFNCYGRPKKLPKFFSKSKYIIVFSVKMAEEINKEELSLLKHTKSFLKSTKFHCDVLCCR